MTITPTQFSHIHAIELPEGMGMIPPERQFPDATWLETHARTVWADGRPVAVFGVLILWEGVGHLFGYVSKDAKRYPLTLVRAGWELLDYAVKTWDFWRLQATVPAEFNRGIRYLQRFGFRVDGLMPYYGPDAADHLMLSRTAR